MNILYSLAFIEPLKSKFKGMAKFLAGLLLLTSTAGINLHAQVNTRPGGRVVIPLSNWQFMRGAQNGMPASSWQQVQLPHTWNIQDVTDDESGYYRGESWYRTTITVGPTLRNKEVFLYFNGANQETEVYVNGKKAGSHAGGYTRFSIPVSRFLLTGRTARVNEITVKVNNRYNENTPPLTADFTFYGGIYRSVHLLAVNRVHFDLADHASNGLYISTPAVSSKSAGIIVRSKLVNGLAATQTLRLVTSVIDRAGKEVSRRVSAANLQAGQNLTVLQAPPPVLHPHLWSPEDPYLYRVAAQLIDARTGILIDSTSAPLGFRWFKFDAEKGFFLNGKPCKLIGASRHQDYEGLGNALPDSMQVRDVKLLKQMGANFLRIAHYPQDPSVLDACDRLGILASVEIPIVNAITESEAFSANCEYMLAEMIRQNYNHPAVIIWGYMNEVLLRPKFIDDKTRQQLYFNRIAELAQKLEKLARREDPYRYTLIANHGDFNLYNRVGLTRIPMLTGWNLYQGWYGGTFKDFGPFLDRHHKELPDKPLLLTEYGADADPRIHALNPERFDKSTEYALQYHQAYLPEILKRPFVAAAAVWNLADFNSETREETMPHINNKGLLNWNREPKDLYFLYRAWFQKNPFIKISSWHLRSGTAAAGTDFCLQPVQVFCNADSAELLLNGSSLGKMKISGYTGSWNVPFTNGINMLQAVSFSAGKKYTDTATVVFKLLPHELHNSNPAFTELNVILGSKRIFIDEKNACVWLPDQPYRPKSWGYTGGEPFRLKNSSRQSYGTDKNINGTLTDPVYQTQQVGIQQYRMDVPDGSYELTLHFAELTGGDKRATLAYNLDSKSTDAEQEERIFDVWLNNKPVLENLDLAAQYGFATAVSKKFTVHVYKGQGIIIDFKPKKGQPVLNALQIKKTSN